MPPIITWAPDRPNVMHFTHKALRQSKTYADKTCSVIILQSSLMVVGIFLHLMVISALFPKLFKTMPLFLLYVVSVLVSTVTQMVAYVDAGGRSGQYQVFYWLTDVICSALLYAALLAFISQIWRASNKPAPALLTFFFYAMVVVSLAAHHTTPIGRWMTLVSRDLNFGAVLLNFLLWVSLLRGKRSNPMLGLASALGIEMAGGAIGHSLRSLSSYTVFPGNMIIIGSHLLCFFLCWRVLNSWNRLENPRPPIFTGRTQEA